MPVAVFYVSGHGFGHAVRMAEVVRELAALESGWVVIVRTTAPSHLFDGIPGVSLQVHSVSIDSGIVEGDGTLKIDIAATVDRLAPFFRQWDELVAAEAEYVRGANADVIVADIPYLAGEIGAKAGVPVLGMSNFTWDFIYEPFLAEHIAGRSMLRAMKDGYDKMHALLRLPFHHEMQLASEVIDVGLVAPCSARAKTDVLRRLGVTESDQRTRIYVGLRGAVPIDALRRAAEESPDCLFFHLGDGTTALPENTRRITMGPELSFPDILLASDTVISKLGYGMVAACVAAGTALLFPTRVGFREDIALRQGAQRFLRSDEISVQDFRSGNWQPQLRSLRDLPLPTSTLPQDGARDCAKAIVAMATSK